MTKIPRYWSQSRESLLDRAYEEISDKFLEGAFHPDGHKEIAKEPELKTEVQIGNQNKIKRDLGKGDKLPMILVYQVAVGLQGSGGM